MTLKAVLLCAAALALCGATAPALASPQMPLIARDALFGNPERSNAQISPDGRYVSFLAPRDGVMNIWVVERGQPLQTARPMTNERTRPIRIYSWAENSQDVLYSQDKGGDENFLLFAVDVRSGVERTLTPFQGVRVLIYAASEQRRDEIVVGINDRDKAWHDPYLLNTRTGALTKLMENTGRYDGFIFDDDLKLRFVTRPTAEGGSEVLRWAGGKPSPFTVIGFEDSQTTYIGGLTNDGRTLYMVESRNRDRSAVTAINLASGETQVVAEDSRADVSSMLMHPTTGKVLAYEVDYLTTEWRAIDPSIKPDLDFLSAQLPGQFSVQRMSDDMNFWVVGHDPVTAPSRAMLYDREARRLTQLYVGRPALTGAPLPQVCPLEITSRDGKTLVSYLALPVGSDPDGDCRPSTPVSMVLNVHGGPWARDYYGFNAETAWLTNRGYASLQVNFRGSTGFGKGFINAGDREWGGKSHDDLIDAVDWAIRNGVTQADKVAIYGGSYGGYATLWGMTGTPDRFACGVAIVAPSNLNTLLASIPPYWEAFKAQMFRRVGDPTTPEGQAFLRERSPLTHVQNIRRPLLIGQGANDPRVKQAEADQIVAAMQAKNIPVTYVLYPDEGHGFARPMNRTSFYAISEAFLSSCLGGRFEPVGDDFDGSSVTVPHGAGFTPGLEAALKAKK